MIKKWQHQWHNLQLQHLKIEHKILQQPTSPFIITDLQLQLGIEQTLKQESSNDQQANLVSLLIICLRRHWHGGNNDPGPDYYPPKQTFHSHLLALVPYRVSRSETLMISADISQNVN